jgi:hypothetical protein
MDPDVSSTSIIRPGRCSRSDEDRGLAADGGGQGLSIREVVIEATGRRPSSDAHRRGRAMDHFVQSDGSDGFVLAPH